MNWATPCTARCPSRRCSCRRRAGEGQGGRGPRMVRSKPLAVKLVPPRLPRGPLSAGRGPCHAPSRPATLMRPTSSVLFSPSPFYFCYQTQTLCSLLPPRLRLSLDQLGGGAPARAGTIRCAWGPRPLLSLFSVSFPPSFVPCLCLIGMLPLAEGPAESWRQFPGGPGLSRATAPTVFRLRGRGGGGAGL